MIPVTINTTSQQAFSVENQRRLFGLEALSKLTRQFAENPNFERLANALMLTIIGQFGVRGVAISITSGRNAFSGDRTIGIGPLKDVEPFASVLTSDELRACFDLHQRTIKPFRVEATDLSTGARQRLDQAGIELLVPMVNGDRLQGILALGHCVGNRELHTEDQDLIFTMTNAVISLLTNSLLFQEIAEIGRRHLSILNSVRHGILVFDHQKQLRRANESSLLILGTLYGRSVVEDDLVGQHIYDIFDEMVFPNWLSQMRIMEYADDASIRKKLIARGVDGEGVYNISLNHLHSGGDPSTREIIVTLDDITAQRTSESRMMELEKFAEQGQMASSIAHELNNFIGMILGGVQLVQLAVEQGNSNKASGFLTRLVESVLAMERFTAGLMDSSRMKAEKRQCDLNRLVTDVLGFVSIQPRFRDIGITTDLSDRMPDMELDEDQMSQVLINLLNNASDAVRTLSDGPKQIHIRTQRIQDVIELTVFDNGCGMTDETKSKLFKTKTTTKSTGHGFGLVTCSKIIAEHGGTLAVESAVGSGSTFTISLPVDH